MLEKTKSDLEQKILFASKRYECDMNCKEQFERRKLEEILGTTNSLRDEMEKLKRVKVLCYGALIDFKSLKINFMNKYETNFF